MNKLKRVTTALMAALIIMTTTYNIYTINVYATDVVLPGGELGDLLLGFLLGSECSYTNTNNHSESEYIQRMQEFEEFISTPEGQAALYQVTVKTVDGKELNVGSNFGQLKQNVAGVVVNPELAYLAKLYFDYITDSANGSTFGAAINAASDQEITVNFPLPEGYKITSVNERLHNVTGDFALSTAYPEYDISNSYYVQAVYPGWYTDMYLIPETLVTSGDAILSINPIRNSGYPVVLKDSSGNLLSTTSYKYWFQNGLTKKETYKSDAIGISTTASCVYLCGDIDIYIGDDPPYHLYPDGTLVRKSDEAVITPSISTPKGHLTSVKPIVGMDISAFVDAICKAIADAHPAEAPVLTQEAIDYITNNVSNVYDNAVTNYYNDTSYIDQSQYITNVTNVFEQAIADNPVIDLPVADTGILSGIKAIPGQIANVLADVFIPDLSLLQGYIDTLLGYFSWALEPWNFFQDLINIIFVDNPEPPKIYIDFSKAESSYIYGGKAVVLDMSWYARYKPYADTIIVSFSYIWLAYWFFRNLPEIISGGSPVPVARSAERAAARMDEEIKRADPEYGRVKVDAVGSITSSKGVHYSGARSAHHNIQDDQLRPKL